jgi:hypothetical protein
MIFRRLGMLSSGKQIFSDFFQKFLAPGDPLVYNGLDSSMNGRGIFLPRFT